MANALAGAAMLLAAWVSGAPDIVHYVGAIFLGLAAVSYVSRFRLPTGKA